MPSEYDLSANQIQNQQQIGKEPEHEQYPARCRISWRRFPTIPSSVYLHLASLHRESSAHRRDLHLPQYNLRSSAYDGETFRYVPDPVRELPVGLLTKVRHIALFMASDALFLSMSDEI